VSATYTPRPGSLPSMVISYLRLNPKATLTLDDIADRFSATRVSIHTNLAMAVDAGQLSREKNDDDEYVYLAGPAIQSASMGLEASTKTASRRGRVRTGPIDFDALTVDEGVPVIEPRRKGVNKWDPLFKKLTKKGQSIAFPIEFKAPLALQQPRSIATRRMTASSA
jgi:hypothetical protein